MQEISWTEGSKEPSAANGDRPATNGDLSEPSPVVCLVSQAMYSCEFLSKPCAELLSTRCVFVQMMEYKPKTDLQSCICSCLRPIGGDDCMVIAAVSARMGRWQQDNKGNTLLLRSWGPIFGPRAPTYISAQGHRVRSRAISLQLSPPNWGRRLRGHCGFLRHGREEKAVTKGLGTDTWTPIVPALCLSG